MCKSWWCNLLKYSNMDIVLEILPIVDNFERAIKLDDNDLTDENFIAINSTEISISDSCIGYKGGWQYLPTYHLNLYAKRQDITEKTEDMQNELSNASVTELAEYSSELARIAEKLAKASY